MVEPEGIEPSSKQGSPELSTRLSWSWFSCGGKTQATNRRLILLSFAKRARPRMTIPDFAVPLCQSASGR